MQWVHVYAEGAYAEGACICREVVVYAAHMQGALVYAGGWLYTLLICKGRSYMQCVLVYARSAYSVGVVYAEEWLRMQGVVAYAADMQGAIVYQGVLVYARGWLYTLLICKGRLYM